MEPCFFMIVISESAVIQRRQAVTRAASVCRRRPRRNKVRSYLHSRDNPTVKRGWIAGVAFAIVLLLAGYLVLRQNVRVATSTAIASAASEAHPASSTAAS